MIDRRDNTGWEFIRRQFYGIVLDYRRDNKNHNPILNEELIISTKEKYGRLDITCYSWCDSTIWDWAFYLEMVSFKTCCKCWNPWETRDLNWVLTLCDECYDNPFPNGLKNVLYIHKGNIDKTFTDLTKEKFL